MGGGDSAEPRINGCGTVAGELVIAPPAPADVTCSLLDEAGIDAAATVPGRGKGIPGASRRLSLWFGLAVDPDFPDGAMKQYHTTPARAQISSITGSDFFI